MNHPLSDSLRSHLTELASASSLLVALDFDGVLAPLRNDPEQSRPLPASVQAIDRLAALPNTHVGYISGRPMKFLQNHTSAPRGALFVGSHGAEQNFAGTGQAPRTDGAGDGAVTAGEQRVLEQLDQAFDSIQNEVQDPGFWVETKPMGRTFHTRDSSPESVPRIAQRLDALAQVLPGTRMLHGKDIVEFSTRHDTKGDGLLRMLDASGAQVALYMGDDLTDEDAFKILRTRSGVGIKVGAGDTVAHNRIESPEAVAQFLTALADAREAQLTPPPAEAQH